MGPTPPSLVNPDISSLLPLAHPAMGRRFPLANHAIGRRFPLAYHAIGRCFPLAYHAIGRHFPLAYHAIGRRFPLPNPKCIVKLRAWLADKRADRQPGWHAGRQDCRQEAKLTGRHPGWQQLGGKMNTESTVRNLNITPLHGPNIQTITHYRDLPRFLHVSIHMQIYLIFDNL
jgi:hypothetical protein